MSARTRISTRVAAITGAEELGEVSARLDTLEAAVAENAALEAPLERIVTHLERTVAGVIEREAGPGVRP